MALANKKTLTQESLVRVKIIELAGPILRRASIS